MEQKPQVYIICGGRRTGTTLLAGILSSDERANPLGQEAQILTRMVEAYRWGSDQFQDFGVSFFGDQQAYKEFFQETFDQFTQNVSQRISPGGVLILKNPELSKVFCSVDELFPNAQLLVMVRDPRDQIAAELQVRSKKIARVVRDMKKFKLKISNVKALAYHFSVRTLTNHYKVYYNEILEIHKEHPKRLKIIRYEDLVQNPKTTLIELENHTKLKFNFDAEKSWPRVSKYAGLDDTQSPSHSGLYGGPIDASSVGRYKRHLNKLETIWIEKKCQGLMDIFGY